MPACANAAPDSTACTKKGVFACGKCHLVSYCGKECQTAHWPVHKIVHKSPASKSDWRPAWDTEGREPAWAIGEARNNAHNPFGGSLFLWGNVPAIDVLRLSENEGAGYSDDIELLFAASGDLRNVVKTIVDLPATVTQPVHATINDREFAVVARNAIWLLFALSTPSEPTADDNGPLDTAEMLTHLWYSAFMPQEVLSAVQKAVKPLIAEVCAKIKDKHSASCLGKTWQFPSGRNLRLVLKKEQWFALEKMLDVPEGFTFDKATKVRHGVTLAPERADYRDRWDFKEPTASMRIARRQFREDGLLLPFGHPRDLYKTPNMTLFQNSDVWLMDDKADPLQGWPIWEVYHRPWPAKQDWYGKLHAYLRGGFGKFVKSLTTIHVSFEMHCVDARELKEHLHCDRYTRIEVSNITDDSHLGLRNTLTSLMPLLQPPQRNPHATLISLFLNAVIQMVKGLGLEGPATEQATGKVLTYLPVTDFASFLNPSGAEMTRMWDARNLFLDLDTFFNLYRAHRNFGAIAAESGAVEKGNNTIVEKWPLRLKRQLGQEGAQEEFRVMLASSYTSMERYMEWTRAVPETITGNEPKSGDGDPITQA
ncbi:hypothetical protein N656DRAFT_824922 [Canariomyces notabilis]|uniref:MYND-type domain-containing protein n=1 Tax=Canariomyces notabilis TaxID=2074819 RepID=A0AAN6YSY1_9PEZI|nr:hypothetical protein N656DRAFT_824922 [Canariomyces arenarius]